MFKWYKYKFIKKCNISFIKSIRGMYLLRVLLLNDELKKWFLTKKFDFV